MSKLIPLASRFKQLEEGEGREARLWKLSKGRRRIIKGKEGTTRWYLGTGGTAVGEEFPLLTQTIGEEVARGISRSRKCTRHSG